MSQEDLGKMPRALLYNDRTAKLSKQSIYPIYLSTFLSSFKKNSISEEKKISTSAVLRTFLSNKLPCHQFFPHLKKSKLPKIRKTKERILQVDPTFRLPEGETENKGGHKTVPEPANKRWTTTVSGSDTPDCCE